MNKISTAIFSAKSLFLTTFLWLFVFGVFNEPLSFDLILYALFFSLLLSFIGFFFSLALLLPLEKVFLVFSGTKSFLVFLLAGFLVPLSTMVLLNMLNNWFFSYEETKVTNNSLTYGVLGAITAAATWRHLINIKSNNNDN